MKIVFICKQNTGNKNIYRNQTHFTVLIFINSRVLGLLKSVKASKYVQEFKYIRQSGLVLGQMPRPTQKPKVYFKTLLSLKIMWFFFYLWEYFPTLVQEPINMWLPKAVRNGYAGF